MPARRKIAIVTGSRADYDLLLPIARQILADNELELLFIVTGMHLSPEFGSTYRQIEADGLRIDARVEMLLSSDSAIGIGKSIGLGTIGFADVIAQLQPDILVVLGDRFEILAAAQAAMIARVPVAHIHGGETTEGAFDEGIRHAITKISQWHFVAAEPYRKRVIQMGESPERVFNFGAPGLDGMLASPRMPQSELEEFFEMELGASLFLVTYHPTTLGEQPPEVAQRELLAALENFPQAKVIFTLPNADTDGRKLRQELEAWVSRHSDRARAYASLGRKRYLSVMQVAAVVLGNSSSGAIEAPLLKTATVNVGDRQKGRLKATSVIDAAERRGDIINAIEQALSPEFRRSLKNTRSLYGSGDASARIKDVLKSSTLTTRKAFFDIEHAF